MSNQIAKLAIARTEVMIATRELVKKIAFARMIRFTAIPA